MAFQGDSIFWVEVDKIVPNPFQPRREFDEEKLRELADSIRMYGVLQPLTVTRKEVHNDDGSFRTEYELIAGERRLRASTLAGVEQVPVIIRSGEQTEQEKLELAIIENLQREDLNAVDRALAFKQLADAFELSHGQVAKKVGRSREYVSNSIRLLALPEVILDALKKGDVSEGHARTLLMLKDKPEEQDVVFREILLKKLSVREVERIVRKIAQDKVRKKHWADSDAHLIELERAFTDTLGTRVQILKTDYGGKLTIDYFSEDDLQTLLKLVATQPGGFEPARTEPVTSAVDEAVSETVIRELDRSTDELATLAAATPLVTDDESVPQVNESAEPITQPEPNVSPEPRSDEVVQSEPSVPAEQPRHEPHDEIASVSVLESAAEPSQHQRNATEPSLPVAPEQTSSVSESPDHQSAEQTVQERTDTSIQPHPPVGESVSEVEQQPTVPTDNTHQPPVPPQPESPATEQQPSAPVQDEQAEALQHEVESIIEGAGGQLANDTPAGEAPVSDEKPADDDDLYSVRNFSV